MHQRGSRGRGLRRGVMCALGALLAVGAVASPAWAVAPDAPPQPTVTGGDAQLTVSFVPPANDGGSPITLYTATCTSSDGGAPNSNSAATSPIDVVALTNGNTYTCTVDAANGDGTSAESPASTPIIVGAPDAPAAPSVLAGDASISVTFGTPPDHGNAITGYSATCTSSNGGLTGSAPGAASPITVGTLTNGKTYTCTVLATNGFGNSPLSLASAAAVPATVPDAPPQPTVVKGNAQIVVTFLPPASDGGSPITGYSSTCTSSDGGATGTITGAVSPITVTGLTNAKTYTCTVTATNAVGPGAVSIASLAIVIGIPDAPAQPTVVAGNNQAVVTFSAPATDGGSPITSYTATCTSSDGGVAGTITGTVSPIAVTGLTNAKTYTCTVRATNANGPGPLSVASASVIPAAVPDAPAQPTVVAGNARIVVTFTAPANNGSPILHYTAQCSSSTGGVPGVHTGLLSPITVLPLSNGASYTCVVKAVSAVGPSPPSPASLAVVPATLPAAPVIRAVASGNGALTISFAPGANNGSPVTSFTVSCTSSTGGVAGSVSGPRSPLIVPALTNGNVYRCTMKETNGVGPSPVSAASKAVIVGQPGAPKVVAVVPGLALGPTGGFHVSFTPPPDNGSAITSYRSTCNPVAGGAVAFGTGSHSPIVVAGLSVGHLYSCVVVATNSRGTSVASIGRFATVGTPTPPRVLQVLPIAGGLVIPFATPDANGAPILDYRARCTSTDGGAPGNPLQLNSPLVVNKLTPGTTYTCQVSALNERGASPPTTVGPVLVSDVSDTDLADCTGTSGGLRATPGLQLAVPATHALKLEATFGSCSSLYVQQAHISMTLRSRSAYSCVTAIGVPNAGKATLTWTAPANMGTSVTTIQLIIDASNGHTTTAHFHGTITSQANMFSGRQVTGTVELDQGITSVGSGGDCSAATRLQKFNVVAASLTIS